MKQCFHCSLAFEKKGCVIIPLVSTRLTDEELIQHYNRSTTAGEAEGYLEELLSRYRNKVISWCLHLTGSTEEASDLAQDIFLKLLNGLSSFRGESRFSTWLYQITRNHCNDFFKRRHHESLESFDESIIKHVRSEAPSLEQRLDRTDLLKNFMSIVKTALTEMERKVAYMHFADGLTLSEITSLLGLTNKSGAKAYLVSAKRKLQERMSRLICSRGINASGRF